MRTRFEHAAILTPLAPVTYGTFRPQADDSEFPTPDVVERDFTLMTAHGVNSNGGRLIHRADPVADALAGRAPER